MQSLCESLALTGHKYASTALVLMLLATAAMCCWVAQTFLVTCRLFCRASSGIAADWLESLLACIQEGLRWVKRWPRWLVVDRVWVQVLWRGSQAAFRPWLATQYLDPPASAVPSTTWVNPSSQVPDMQACCSHSLHTITVSEQTDS